MSTVGISIIVLAPKKQQSGQGPLLDSWQLEAIHVDGNLV